MGLITKIIESVIQAAFVFAIAPLAAGIMLKVKARFQGRIGAPVYQPYFDLSKLFMKGTVTSSTASWVFIAAPIAFFSSIVIAAMALPILFSNSFVSIDFVLFVYLFAIGRFMTALAALDIGSAFGGIGASREMLYSCLIEPVLFAAIVFFSTFNAKTGLISLTTAFAGPDALFSPAFWLSAAALFIVILAETGRLPFDNPSTHLELTMVHEAMILDYSGPLLGLIEWANAAKMVVFLSLFSMLFLPSFLPALSTNFLASVLVFVVVLLALGILVAVVESLTPKWRLFKISKLLTFSLILSLTAFLIRVYDGIGTQNLTAILAFTMLVSALYFIFSATFNRRLKIFVIQSVMLSAIFALIAFNNNTIDAYWRLGSTLLFKVIVLPFLLMKAFQTLSKESKTTLNIDPVFLGSPVSISKSLFISGVLILFSYLISAVLEIHNPLLPVALSIIMIGGLIIATKTHVILQIMGFLILENGLVLLPTALSLEIPLFGEIAALFDTVTLVVVALVLALKINEMIGSLDSVNLDKLLEEK